ncbi:MAG: Flp pilus assembly complex ATPase component TadA [Deltaproteobacteria bacterium]|nr:Flp pilus assembly complex ATPase component TadA [Deltaproteobacteria bacterium]
MKTLNGSKKLGEILVESGLITKDQLSRSIEEQKKTRKRLGEVLVESRLLTEADISRTLSIQLAIPYTDISSAVVEPEAVESVPEKLAEKHLILPLGIEGRDITIAMADPLNFEAIKDVEFATGRSVRPTISTTEDIKKAIKQFYHLADPTQEIVEEMSHGFVEVMTTRVEAMDNMEAELKKIGAPPIIRMVNNVMFHAVNNNASDIHIEPREKNVLVRERIDGLLREVFQFPKWVQGSITSRIKILARLDIAEKRVPQDGRIKIRIEDREVDLRISTLPVQYGESVVVRILDTKAAVLKVEDLGMTGKDREGLKNAVERPEGIIIVTGPTGSGKTSTLYAVINSVKAEAINIITLEDPIEYELSGVNQVAINEKTGLTFAYGLRSVLRQDPDVIMVGEMRDAETANIAVQASLTGHLVLTSLHTNTSIQSVNRLRNLGIQPYMIASSLNGVIAQRLVRKLCARCKQPYKPSQEELLKIGLKEKDATRLTFYRGKGCEECSNTGYRGRTGLFEIFTLNKQIRELIATSATEEMILKVALETGMKSLSEDGIDKVKSGTTSIDELIRVLYVQEEGVLVCKNCGSYVRTDFVNCPYCGYSIVDRCPDCGRHREADWKYCPFCQKAFG